MMGQANVFFRYFPEKIPAATDLSLADIANWWWARTYKWSGVSIDGLDHLKR